MIQERQLAENIVIRAAAAGIVVDQLDTSNQSHVTILKKRIQRATCRYLSHAGQRVLIRRGGNRAWHATQYFLESGAEISGSLVDADERPLVVLRRGETLVEA